MVAIKQRVVVSCRYMDPAKGGAESIEPLIETNAVTAAAIESELREKYELLLGWSIVEAPPEVRKAIRAEAEAARADIIKRWNRAVLDALPRIISSIEEEQKSRGGNWGTRMLLNAKMSLLVAQQCLQSGSAWGVGSKFDNEAVPKKFRGVSYATWKRVLGIVPVEDRLPLGLF